MFEIMVEDTFASAHQLAGYEGPCENMHGHTWKVQAFFSGDKLNETGMLFDFKEARKIVKNILAEFDHTNLNELPYFVKTNPTAENIAKIIYGKIKENKTAAGLSKNNGLGIGGNMRDIPFIKMHGSGNDFVIIDMMGAVGRPPLPDDPQLPDFAAKICDRHFGVGADGLILVLPSGKANYKMRIFNCDGSEAEMCGNGIRCFTRYVWETSDEKKDVISVETIAGIMVPAVIVENGKFAGVEVDMGVPKEESLNEDLYVNRSDLKINKISMGNPHCVIFADDLSKINLEEIGPVIENLPQFPNRTNVEFVKVINRNEIQLIVWERGAGMTLACGTGACAAVAAAVLNDLTGKKVLVHLPGGDLEIEWSNDNHILMRGPAEKVFEGKYFIE